MNHKSTINLPRTPFPMKANLAVREPEMLKRWEEGSVYDRIQAARAQAYKAASCIEFDGRHYRRDIAADRLAA